MPGVGLGQGSAFGLHWVAFGLAWPRLGWPGLAWIALAWIGWGPGCFGREGMAWSEEAWVGLGWLGVFSLCKLGLGWLRLPWVGVGVWVRFGCVGLS